MGSAVSGTPGRAAGRRAGMAKARNVKAARGAGASISAVSAARLLPAGDPAPPLTADEVNSLHPVTIGLYRHLAQSPEAQHFDTTNWFSVKIVLMMVSGHLNDIAGHTLVIEDPDTGEEILRRDQYRGVKVGVLAEVNNALASIHATPLGRTNFALALAALAKATAPDDPTPDEAKDRDAEAATARLLELVANGGPLPETG